MDVNFFVKQRTAFIGGFLDEAIAGFQETQRRIDQAEPPFDNPPYSEDSEPAFLTEWIDAGAGAELVAQACVALLSDTLKLRPADFDAYWKQMKMWGDPSDANIKALFLRLGVADVFNGLSWRRTNNSAIKKNLEVLNIVRNQIARCAPSDRQPSSYSLSLAEVVRFRNIADAFGNRFEHHVASFIP